MTLLLLVVDKTGSGGQITYIANNSVVMPLRLQDQDAPTRRKLQMAKSLRARLVALLQSWVWQKPSSSRTADSTKVAQWNNKNTDRRSMPNYCQHETTIWRLAWWRNVVLDYRRCAKINWALILTTYVALEFGRWYFQPSAILMLLYVCMCMGLLYSGCLSGEVWLLWSEL